MKRVQRVLDFLNRPVGGGGGNASSPPGLVAPRHLTERLRRVAAVWTDGRVLVVEGKEDDPELRSALLRLRREKVVPDALREESGTVEEVAEAWGLRPAGAPARGEGADPAMLALLKGIFGQAARARASDVVLENGPGGCRAFVIANDRKLAVGVRMTPEEGERATGFLFHMRDTGSDETGYQRGSFQGFSVRNRGLPWLPESVSGLRCQRGPHEPDGDHMYCRLFYRDQLPEGTTLGALGFSREQSELFAEVRSSMRGAVFVGGVTGDGKSTSLACNLMLQMQEAGNELNLVTIEDPVEYVIPGALQIPVPPGGTAEERTAHFRGALMHFCRIHPASGMVSEIRDGEAARQVLQFVDSGHQVWTTIHVGTANAILFRLLDLGVEVPEVCKPGNIALLVKQSLVSRLCSGCALSEPPDPRAVPRRLFGLAEGWPRTRWRNPEGCERCAGGRDEIGRRAWAGYERQLVVAETIRPDEGYLEFVKARDAGGAWRYWRDKMGGRPIGTMLWEMVLQGGVDPRDAIRKGADLDGGEDFAKRLVERGKPGAVHLLTGAGSAAS